MSFASSITRTLTLGILVAGITLAGCLAGLSLAQSPPQGPPLADVIPSDTASAPEAQDPEAAVRLFIEQNQKQAESQLKNLKDEAERLRARLQKVEAGIKRWETYLSAIKQSQDVAPPANGEASKAAGTNGPADLLSPDSTKLIGAPAGKAESEAQIPAPKAIEPPPPSR
jgi:hypothetical protein